MKWRILMWLAVVIAVLAAAGLGSDVVVAGVTKAAGLAGVIVGFCELGALVLGVVGWAGERRAAQDRSESGSRMPDQDSRVPGKEQDKPATTSMAGKYVVDARQAQGVQIGEHAIQHNVFGSPASPGDLNEADP